MLLAKAKANNWRKDLSASIYDFQRVVYPTIKEQKLLDGELIPLEVATLQDYQHLTKQFDLLSGIDVWHIKTNIGIQGIASRIQWVERNKAFNSFTVRKTRTTGTKTEYEKRKESIQAKGEWLYPYYSLQAYIENPKKLGDLISIAIAKTEDILNCLDCYGNTKTAYDGNTFLYINWTDMQEHGYPISIFINEPEEYYDLEPF